MHGMTILFRLQVRVKPLIPEPRTQWVVVPVCCVCISTVRSEFDDRRHEESTKGRKGL